MEMWVLLLLLLPLVTGTPYGRNRIQRGAETSPYSVSDEELLELSSHLWYQDVNMMVNGTDFIVDLHGDRFFTYMDTAKLDQHDTYSAMLPLLTTYNPELKENEVLTDTMYQREHTFLSTIMTTRVMKTLHAFLADKGKADSTEAGFIKELKYWWFTKFSRTIGGNINDTSGWEHVFVGEYKHAPKRTFKGFHNWVQLYWEEAAGNITDMSYMSDCSGAGYRMKFRWQDRSKSPGCSFILGSSPEYDMAVYTLCFLTRPGGTCTINTYSDKLLSIKTYVVGPRSGRLIATAFPLCQDPPAPARSQTMSTPPPCSSQSRTMSGGVLVVVLVCLVHYGLVPSLWW